MQDYFKRLRRGESLDDRPRLGRPRKLTSTLRRQLGQIKAIHPKEKTRWYAHQLSRVRGEPVGEETTRKALRQLDYRDRLIPRRTLTSAQKAARVAFGEAHLEDAWDRRWSFDQCYFNLYRNNNRFWVRQNRRCSLAAWQGQAD